MTKPVTARIEVFRAGTFQPMSGEPITYSAADLRAIADIYDFDTAPAPVVVGHPSTDAPAFGWAQSFEYDATRDRLYATVGELAPAFAEAVKKGSYKKVSMSFFRPDQPANPVPGSWYPKHIGFLGGAAPAVTGLRNVQFSANDGSVTLTPEFGERGFEVSSSLLRSLRDLLIEKFGLETADKALPSYQIEWLADIEISPAPEVLPAFSAPPVKTEPKEPAVTKQPDPAFATREADLSTREEALKKREREIAHEGNVAFADGLVEDGRLLPASKDKVVAILDALPSEASVSFVAGEAKLSPADAIRALLKDQPKVVSYGALAMPPEGGQASASFAADGHEVDRQQLDRHNRALAYQREHPGTQYLDAVRAVG